MMLLGLPLVALIAGLVLVGLYISNVCYDYGTPQYISRKIGHGVGGVGYLLCALMFSSPWYPLIISGGFTLLLGGARLLRPSTFRGVGGSSRRHALAEIWYPLAGTVSLIAGWAWLGSPWLGVLPALYLGFGDAVTGLTRSWHCKKEKKGWCGTFSMLVVCLLVSQFLQPYWIGFIMAVTATLAERLTPMSRGWMDDNWTLVISSALVGSILYVYFG